MDGARLELAASALRTSPGRSVNLLILNVQLVGRRDLCDHAPSRMKAHRTHSAADPMVTKMVTISSRPSATNGPLQVAR